jgi:two-component system cell cycle sensor histidine kinase/response regulator CckA
MVDRKGLLIVEDENEIRLLLGEVFRIENFEVFQASDGREALGLFREHQDDIDIVITDLGLPHLGGVELIEQMRAMKPGLKIIGSSGYGRANITEEVLNAGGDVFLPKPFVTSELIRTVRRLLAE